MNAALLTLAMPFLFLLISTLSGFKLNVHASETVHGVDSSPIGILGAVNRHISR